MSTTSLFHFLSHCLLQGFANPKPETPQTAKVATWVAEADLLNETPESLRNVDKQGGRARSYKTNFFSDSFVGDR